MAALPSTPGTTIDLGERFPHLSRAPVVEAVIDLRARAESAWEEKDVLAQLKAALPDYPNRMAMRGFSVSFSMNSEQATSGTPVAPATPQDHGWMGIRCTTADGLNIATFNREGFSFSRLKPYDNWDSFSKEAVRLWELHTRLAAPIEVSRLGVRFINRLDVPVSGLAFEDYFNSLPKPPVNLGSLGFLFHDILSVPGHPYVTNRIRTFQPPEGENAPTLGLLLDIDVAMPGPIVPESGKIAVRLAEMHWVKNQVFFGSVTEKALNLCR